jgi:hypothetical protein
LLAALAAPSSEAMLARAEGSADRPSDPPPDSARWRLSIGIAQSSVVLSIVSF